MSFNLTVWRANNHVTAAEAERLNAEWCSRPISELKPSAEMTEFVRDVAADFRAGQIAENDEPWAVEPDIGDGYVLMAIPSSVKDRVEPIVRRLAAERGLACFDPQNSVVYNPIDRQLAATQLELYGNEIVLDFDQQVLASAIRNLSDSKWYAILRRGAEEYIQVGLGPQAGVRSGHYAIEYRAGSPEEHFRTVVSDVVEVVRTFAEYLDGNDAFPTCHSWKRVHF